jgi:hypothetical protein
VFLLEESGVIPLSDNAKEIINEALVDFTKIGLQVIQGLDLVLPGTWYQYLLPLGRRYREGLCGIFRVSVGLLFLKVSNSRVPRKLKNSILLQHMYQLFATCVFRVNNAIVAHGTAF